MLYLIWSLVLIALSRTIYPFGSILDWLIDLTGLQVYGSSIFTNKLFIDYRAGVPWAWRVIDD